MKNTETEMSSFTPETFVQLHSIFDQQHTARLIKELKVFYCNNFRNLA